MRKPAKSSGKKQFGDFLDFYMDHSECKVDRKLIPYSSIYYNEGFDRKIGKERYI